MTPDIGLALSGGGSRAAAFHLGCLRALHDRNLLTRVRVISGISGGSLLAALWAYGPERFHDFDAQTVDLLRRGLHTDILKGALNPAAVTRNLTSAARTALARRRPTDSPQATRHFNRTDALASALTQRAFGGTDLTQVTHARLDTVLTATDLITGNAVRFGSARSSCAPSEPSQNPCWSPPQSRLPQPSPPCSPRSNAPSPSTTAAVKAPVRSCSPMVGSTTTSA